MAVSKSQADWQKENTVMYRIRVTKSSGIIDAMEKMTADTGKSPNEYLREALLEKLDFDGYINMELARNLKPGRKKSE